MEEHEGIDDGRSVESYVVLDSAARMAPLRADGSSEYQDPRSDVHASVEEGRTLTHQLRFSTNSTQLTSVLMEIWRPSGATPDANAAEETPAKKGTVAEVDIEEILFAVEEELKKLISLMAYKKTLFVTKTAAMDVFTWISGLDVVLDNPVVSKGDIVKWILNLCSTNDAITESVGLRGIRNLVGHEDYRRLLTQHDEFVCILDYIGGEDVTPVKHADVYVLEIYHTVMNADGGAPGQDVFLERLLKRMETDHLTSEARLWGMKCIETCIRVMPDRDGLLDGLIDGGDLLVWLSVGNEEVLSHSLDVTLTCLSHASHDKTLVLLNGIAGRSGIVDKLFERLRCGLSQVETQILKLLCRIAKNLPNTFYEDLLDEYWIKLQIVLEQGSEETKECLLELLHHVAVAAGPVRKNIPLPLPVAGVPFVKLLLEGLNSQTFKIVHFMWSHYQDVLPVLTELNVVSAVLSTLLSVNGWSAVTDLEEVQDFLSAVALKAGNPEDCFGDCLIPFLDCALDASDEDYMLSCLSLGLGLLVKLNEASEESRGWLIEHGLTALMEKLIWSPQCLNFVGDTSCLFSVCHTLLCVRTEDQEQQRSLDSLFVGVMNAADVYPVNEVLQFFASLKAQAPGKVYFSEGAEIPEAIRESGLAIHGLRVLRELIHEWTMAEDQQYLISLLSVLLKCCLEISSVQAIDSSCVLKSLANLLLVMKPTALASPTVKILMECMAAAERKCHGLLASFIGVAGSVAVTNLWNLIIDYQGSQLLPVSDGKSILALLKTVSNLQPDVNGAQQMIKLTEETESLKEAVYEKNRLIAELESKLSTASREMQELIATVGGDGGGVGEAQPEDQTTLVQLEVSVKRQQRLLEEKETVMSGLFDRNEQLLAEIQNRDRCYADLVQVVDTQHERVAMLEGILESEGYRVVS